MGKFTETTGIFRLAQAGKGGVPTVEAIRQAWAAFKRRGYKGQPPEWSIVRCLRNDHPTVKPLSLMRWCVRLITPLGGVCLDPFGGSFTTGVAAIEEGFSFVGMERQRHYVTIGRWRLRHAAQKGRSKAR